MRETREQKILGVLHSYETGHLFYGLKKEEHDSLGSKQQIEIRRIKNTMEEAQHVLQAIGARTKERADSLAMGDFYSMLKCDGDYIEKAGRAFVDFMMDTHKGEGLSYLGDIKEQTERMVGVLDKLVAGERDEEGEKVNVKDIQYFFRQFNFRLKHLGVE